MEHGRDERERAVVGDDRRGEGLREVEDVVDAVDGDVAEGGRVRDDRIVPVGQIQSGLSVLLHSHKGAYTWFRT